MHGAFYKIAMQGFVGLMCCVVFLKCGGIRKDYFTGLLWSTIAHVLYNSNLYVVDYFHAHLR